MLNSDGIENNKKKNNFNNNRSTGVSICTDGRRNTSASLLIEVGYFFTE